MPAPTERVHEALDRMIAAAVTAAGGIPIRQVDADNLPDDDRGLWGLPSPQAIIPEETQQGFTRYKSTYVIQGSWSLPGEDLGVDWAKIHEQIDRLLYQIDTLGGHLCRNGALSGFRSGRATFQDGDSDDEIVCVIQFDVRYFMNRQQA